MDRPHFSLIQSAYRIDDRNVISAKYTYDHFNTDFAAKGLDDKTLYFKNLEESATVIMGGYEKHF